MKLLSKSLLGCLALSGVMGLTACQSMSTDTSHMNDAQHQTMNLSDNQILKVVSVANLGEIQQAKTAMPKLQTEQARSFALAMIEAHTKNELKGQTLAKRLNLMPQATKLSNALQVDSNNIVMKLSKSAAPLDKDYMMAQVMVHRKVLKSIDEQLITSANNDELRAMLVETRGAVAMHLEAAEKLVAMMR